MISILIAAILLAYANFVGRIIFALSYNLFMAWHHEDTTPDWEQREVEYNLHPSCAHALCSEHNFNN